MRNAVHIWCATAVMSLFATLPTARADQLTFSAWKTTTPFDGPRTSHAAVLLNNRIYILGGLYASGNTFTLYNDVQTALLGNDGAIAEGAWAKTTPFVEPRSGLGVAVHKGFIYVVGGFSNNGTRADAQYARVMPDGMLGSWTTSPNQLAIPRSNLALQIFATTSGTSYLAAIAGVGEVCRATWEIAPRIASVKMLPDNFPVVSGAELPNQFGGGYGREDQHARKARDHISAGGALSGERTAREGTDPGRAVCRYGMASQARYPSTVGGRGIGIGRAAATEPDLRSFHSRCTDCAMGRL